MTKTEQVHEQWVQAMKEKNAPRKETLSLLMSALKGKAKDKCAPLTAEEEDTIILHEIKQTKESLDSANGRTDIIEECTTRLAILQEFAPVFMDETQIRAKLEEVLSSIGITEPSAKDRGAIMKALMPEVKGKADGALVAKIVGERLG